MMKETGSTAERSISSRGSSSTSSTSSSHHHQLWTKLRSIWRLKIVGLIVFLGSIYWLQNYHFQFGMTSDENVSINYVDNDSKEYFGDTKVSTTTDDMTPSQPKDSPFNDLVGVDDEDDDGDGLYYDNKVTKNDEAIDNLGIDDDDDDDDDDTVTVGGGTRGYQQQGADNAMATTAAPTPCPFLSPKITGQKKWTLYPPQAYEGLSLLRSTKESILMTAFPGCAPMVLPKQVRH